MEVFQDMIESSRFQQVLCYYSGFTKLADPAVREFIQSYSKKKLKFQEVLPLLHCLFEAQQPSLCKIVESHFHFLTLDNSFTPVDHLVIGYVIAAICSTSSSYGNRMHLRIKDSNDHKVKLLLVGLSHYVGEQSALTKRSLVLDIDVHKETTCKVISFIADHLKASSPISELVLFIHHFENRVLYLAEAMQTNNSLTKLSLFSAFPIIEAEFAFGKMLQANKTLTHLDLSCNQNFIAKSLFLSLQHNTTLVNLNLSNTGLTATEDTISAFSEMLRKNKKITHLDLSHNTRLAHCVFSSLRYNTTLVCLNLSSAGIAGTATHALGEMVRLNKTLTHLDLSYNENLADYGACCIFQHNTTLVYLDLSQTGITNKGAEYIIEALKRNCSLEVLNIFHNLFELHLCHQIIKSLQSNTTLKTISMYNVNMCRYLDSTRHCIEVADEAREKKGLLPIEIYV